MARVSSDPYQSPSETFSTLIDAEAVCPLPPLSFSCNPSHHTLCIVRALVVQNSSLALTAKLFSLATEDQDFSRGSQPHRQLDLAQSFNDMRVNATDARLAR